MHCTGPGCEITMIRFVVGVPHRRAATLRAHQVVGLLIVFLAGWGCGDDGHPGGDVGVHDARVDGSLPDLDAYVDNGPLDCGVRPEDGAVCVTGRLHDWTTDEPIPAHSEQQILSFEGYDHPYLDVKYDPASRKGRVDPNGRFFAWTNQADDRCLSLYEPIPGYKSDTLNCYDVVHTFGSYYQRQFRLPFRFYLLPEQLFDTWVEAYPGVGDFTVDSPLWVGTCRYEDWTKNASARSGWKPNPWFTCLNNTCEMYGISPDLQGFVEVTTAGVCPEDESASCAGWSKLEYEGAPIETYSSFEFFCESETREADWSLFWLNQELVSSGEVDLVLVNVRLAD
jgi:hypothetical protein